MERKSGDRVKQQAQDIKQAYEHGKQSARELAEAAVNTSKEAAAVTDEWVRGNSWKLLGITLAAGFIVGLLCARRSSQPDTERLPR